MAKKLSPKLEKLRKEYLDLNMELGEANWEQLTDDLDEEDDPQRLIKVLCWHDDCAEKLLAVVDSIEEEVKKEVSRRKAEKKPADVIEFKKK